jgi:hypothetical protein
VRRDVAGILGVRILRRFVGGDNVGYCERARIGRPDGWGVSFCKVFLERFRRAVSVFAAAACADLPFSIEDDPGVGVFAVPKAGRLGFTARHGVTIFLIARGVVKSLPATRATSSLPAAISVRNEDKVSGPCGKNTETASTRVMLSSSPQSEGFGRAFTLMRRSRVMGAASPGQARSTPPSRCLLQQTSVSLE